MKVKRKDAEGNEQEIEIEEKDLQDGDVKVLDTEPGKTNQEKTLTQAEFNKAMADERRKHEAKFNALKGEFDTYKGDIEAKEKAANDAAAEKVEALRKDVPESLLALLDKLSAVEQLEWLTNPDNVITKKEIPPLPHSNDGHGKQRKNLSVV